MATFTWMPDYGANVDKQPKTRVVQFGDGYMQRQAESVNTMPENWSLSFSNRDLTEINAIEAFLTSAAGVDNFDWVPPRQAVAKKFICRKWTRNITVSNLDTITATFEQVYES
jgi:phage-related protein